MNAIIIDDEKRAREVLKYHLEEYVNHVHIIAEYSNIEQATRHLSKNEFDVIFLDINMPGGDGFDFLSRNKLDNKLIVFVTAHDQYALKAFKAEAFDYLLKPIEINELKRVINKLDHQISLMHPDNEKKNETIAIKAGYDKVLLNTNDVLYIQSEGNYSTVHTTRNTTHVISKNLKKVEALYFQNNCFIRIHQSVIVNANHISSFDRTIVKISNLKQLKISKNGYKLLNEKWTDLA